MKISVVMCTYNGLEYITQQMDSLRAQTVDLHEVIICDDHSTDGTLDLVRAYLEQHALTNWHVCGNAANKGYRRNFRDAVDMAQGDWIALCDQDDIWHSDKLQRLSHIAATYPQARLVAGSFDLIDADGKPIVHETPAGQSNHGLIHVPLVPGTVYRFERNTKNTAMLLSGNMALGCTMMVRRDTAQEFVQNSSLELPHDWDMALWAFARDGLFFLNEPVIHYRLHGNNTIGLPTGRASKKKVAPSYKGRIDVMNHYDDALKTLESILERIGAPALDARYASYGALRRRMLEKHSVPDWLRLHRYYRIYADMFTFKQRLGDLLVLLSRP